MNPCDVKYGLRYLFRGEEGVVEQIAGHPRRGFTVKFQPRPRGPAAAGVAPSLCVPLGEFAAEAVAVSEACTDEHQEQR